MYMSDVNQRYNWRRFRLNMDFSVSYTNGRSLKITVCVVVSHLVDMGLNGHAVQNTLFFMGRSSVLGFTLA